LTTARGMKILHNTAAQKQWAIKWPYMANAALRIVENHGE